MKNELDTLLDYIGDKYAKFTIRPREAYPDLDGLKRDLERINAFRDGLSYEVGRKYIKIIKEYAGGRSVWGFVVGVDNDKNFRKGDILKAASWNAPARNKARGNILDGGYSVDWTGPHYL